MIIKKACALSPEQLIQAGQLQSDCLEHDGLKHKSDFSNELNFDPSLPCFYLGYEGDALVCMLTAFMPTSSEAEIMAFTHPNCRRQGRFSALLDHAVNGFRLGGIKKLIFLVEQQSAAGRKAVSALPGCRHKGTELRLVYSGSRPPEPNPRLRFAKAEGISRADAIQVYVESFGMAPEDAVAFVRHCCRSQSREIYLMYDRGAAIGVFGLNKGTDIALIFGLGVRPWNWGQGNGTQLLLYALNQALSYTPRVALDVDKANKSAYSLYTKNGFAPDYEVDYYDWLIALD